MKTLLKNAFVLDGTGNKGYTADILLNDQLIEAIGSYDNSIAETVINVSGSTVAPGFIDSHSHNDWFAVRKDNERFFSPFLQQGITTQVTGNCGFSPFGYDKGTEYEHLLGSGLFSKADAEGDFSTAFIRAYEWQN